MKKLIAGVLLAGATLLGAAEPAECVWCPTYKCYGPCGVDCLCISQPGEIGGRCYGVQGVPGLLAKGMEELR